MVTSSSADVGWIPTVESNCFFVNPAFTATANPCQKEHYKSPHLFNAMSVQVITGWFKKPCKEETLCVSSTMKKQSVNVLTCIISGLPSPHMWMPTTLSVVASTIIFTKVFSGKPDNVTFIGLNDDVYTSMSPNSSIACTRSKIKSCELPYYMLTTECLVQGTS